MDISGFARSMRQLAVCGVMVLVVAAPSTALAEDQHDGHQHHKNLLAGFVGVTSKERRDRALTLGIDYERRVSELFGIGIGVERVFGDLDFTVLTIPVNFHFGHWKVFGGPGVEFVHGDKEHELIRAGVEYAFDMGGYELAPKIMLDIVDGDVVVIGGVAFAFGF